MEVSSASQRKNSFKFLEIVGVFEDRWRPPAQDRSNLPRGRRHRSGSPVTFWRQIRLARHRAVQPMPILLKRNSYPDTSGHRPAVRGRTCVEVGNGSWFGSVLLCHFPESRQQVNREVFKERSEYAYILCTGVQQGKKRYLPEIRINRSLPLRIILALAGIVKMEMVARRAVRYQVSAFGIGHFLSRAGFSCQTIPIRLSWSDVGVGRHDGGVGAGCPRPNANKREQYRYAEADINRERAFVATNRNEIHIGAVPSSL